jgi:hypothetical protein
MASLIDDALEDDDFFGISIMPSKSLKDRVVKVNEIEIQTEELYECNVQTNTDREQYDVDTQTDILDQKEIKQLNIDLENLGNWLESIYPKVANILEQNATSRTFDNYELKSNNILEANVMLHKLTTTFEFTDAGIGEDEEDGGEETGTFQEYQDDIDEWGDMQSIGKREKPSMVDASSSKVRSNASRSQTQSAAINEESKSLTFDVTSISWSCNGSTIAVAYGKQNHPSMSFQGCVSVWGIFRRDLEPNKPSKNIEVGN